MVTRTPSRAARRVLLGTCLGLPVGAACSLALDLDSTKPCVSDGDCLYTTGQGACVDGFCQPPGSGQESSSTGDPTLTSTTTPSTDDSTTTQGTTTGNETDDSTTTTGVTECELNSQCGDDERCSDAGVCVSLLSAECTVVQWPEDRDDVEFLGSIMPVSPPFDTLVVPLQNAHQLAVEDFNAHASLQSGQRIAWVGCDSTGGASTAVAAAEHLRDVVGVHAIVGPVFSESVRQVAEDVTVPADIFVISPTASAPSLSNFADDNLVWRVTPSDVYQGNAIIDRFTIDMGIDPVQSRVLVLNKDDAYGNELRDFIGPDFQAYFDNVYFDNYPGPETFPDQMAMLAEYAGILAQALTQPGVTDAASYVDPQDHYTHILLIGTSEAEAFILSYVGLWAQQYFAMNPAIPLPIITVSHGAVPSMEQIVINAGAAGLGAVQPLLFNNMRGTSPNIFDADNFDAFNFRYQILFPGEEALTSSSLSYDAALAAMFAMVTIPEGEPITGTGIANGMARLNDPRGTVIDFGENVGTFIQAARNALAAGNTVDLQGVSGALNWDPTNGEIRADVLGWRLAGTPADPQLNPYCLYALMPEPATTGTWISLATGMPPCG
ncbi:MAG: ABC transporter substrate-binding protein [Myxococcales bacterium]|nr:ABC transporter substrate-binding protein [Myxococcales bacterium]